MAVKLGKALYIILSGNTVVYNYVGTKIYPLVIPENTTLPCIVYERSADIEYTKDGAGVSTSGIDVTILSEDYSETIDISQAVYDVLNDYSGVVLGITIINCRCSGIYESYSENAFIQKLTFTIKSY